MFTGHISNWQLFLQRKLTLFGRVYVIKTYLMSKLVYPASMLVMPDDVKKQIKTILYSYLWNGKRDRVKRSVVCNSKTEGGLNMLDIDQYLRALKAAWVPKIMNLEGKWSDYFNQVIKELKIPNNYIWKTTARKIDTFPLMKLLPSFYQQVVLSFNQCKYIKPLSKLNVHELIQQPLWGSEYFKLKNTCMYYKQWASSNMLYVKDLVIENGCILNDRELYDKVREKQNIHQEIFVVKNYIVKHIRDRDLSIAPYVNIKDGVSLIFNNKVYGISNQKSRFFYSILTSKIVTRLPMESIYSREFNFQNQTALWQSIYKQKLCDLKIKNLEEFNYKLLNNIVPCGYVINKWKANIPKYCDVCGELETTKHMLYDCDRINQIWRTISSSIKCNIEWKTIVCGFPGYSASKKLFSINFVISVIAYAIFKENSYCKFNDKVYANVKLKQRFKENMIYYKNIVEYKGVCNDILLYYICQVIDNI